MPEAHRSKTVERRAGPGAGAPGAQPRPPTASWAQPSPVGSINALEGGAVQDPGIFPPKPTIHHYIRGWGGSLSHTHHLELHLTIPPPHSLV